MRTSAAAAPLIYASRIAAPANDNQPPLIIDLFAGGGGASTAIKWATGREPDIAVNHNADAVALHAMNHPKTLHLCEDIRQINPVDVLLEHFPGRQVGLLWASPDCRHHSKASGGALKDRGIRGLAWEVVRWAAMIKRATGQLPAMICLENVEEFEDWCPVHRYGKKAGKAMKARRRETFLLWVAQLRSIGYTAVEWRNVIAANHGAPTTRRRLFLVARCDGVPITWPKRSHASRAEFLAAQQPKKTARKPRQTDLFMEDRPPEAETETLDLSGMEMWKAAATIIDWNLKCPSIFGRKKALAPKTRARIAKGIKRYVIEAERPFLINVNHSSAAGGNVYDSADPLKTATAAKGGNFQFVSPTILPVTHAGGQDRVYDPLDPTRTVTAAHRGEMALAGAYLVPRYGERPGQAPRALDIENPHPTAVPDGNGASLVAATLLRTDMQSAKFSGVFSAEDPIRTITSSGGIAATAVHMIRQFGTAVGRDMGRPHPAVMTDGAGGKSGIVATHLSSVAYGDGRPRAGLRASSMEDPTGAVTTANDKTVVATHLTRMAKGSVGSAAADPALTGTAQAKDGVVAAYMAQHNFDRVGRSVEEPTTTQTHRGTQQQIVAPVLDKYYGNTDCQALDESLDTITAKDRFGLASAFLEQANTGMVGHDLRATMPTIVAGGDSGWGATQRLVSVMMSNQYTSNTAGGRGDLNEPAKTITTGGHHALIELALEEMGAPEGSKRRAVLEFLWEEFGEPTAEQWAAPEATAEGRLRFGLVILQGAVWQIVDIGMRMLTPRELYNAQGFPADYIIDHVIGADGVRRELTKTAQTKMAGNSVSPPPAAAILRENVPHLMLGYDSMSMRMAA